MKRLFLIFSLVGLCIFSTDTRAELTSFVADAVQVVPGREVRRGKLYVSELGTRFEFMESKRQVIQIIEPAKGLFRLLFPKTKTYIEVKSAPLPVFRGRRSKVPCIARPHFLCRKVGLLKSGNAVLERWVVGSLKGKRGIKSLWDPSRHMFVQLIYPDGSKMEAHMNGVVTFEGRSVERWKMTLTKVSGLRQNTYMLFAPDLGYPVMEQGESGLVKELHNIKLHTQDKNLYEVPADYRKVSVPVKAKR